MIMEMTNVPILISQPRSGSWFLNLSLMHFGFSLERVFQDYGDYVIPAENTVFWGHVEDMSESVLRDHIDRFPYSKVTLLIRRNTIRQAVSRFLTVFHKEKTGEVIDNIKHKKLDIDIEIPDPITSKHIDDILKYKRHFDKTTKDIINLILSVGIPNITLFYEDDLLGKGECCMRSLAERLALFWGVSIPSFEPKRKYWQVVTHRKTDVRVEMFYQEVKEMIVGQYDKSNQ